MKLVTSLKQIEKNIEWVENYLVDGTDQQKEQIGNLIRRGKSLVAYQVSNEIRFAPSRFLGYVANSLEKHAQAVADKLVDGKETNPVLTKLIGSKLEQNEQLDKLYVKYCHNLGQEATAYSKRRFWQLDLTKEFHQNEIVEGLFPEGKIVERIHTSRERNNKVIKVAKQNFKAKYGKLFCQACGFSFDKVYGNIGKDFIEGHHTIPVHEMKPGHKTSPDDIAMLCSNCHRMVHKKRPWLSVDKLKSLLK